MVSRAVLVVLVVGLVIAAPAAAAPSTPTAIQSPGGAMAGLLDLAAFVPTPDDLPDPGYGIYNGAYRTLDATAAGINGASGGTGADLAAVRSALEQAGWRQGYYLNLAIPSGDDPSKAATDYYVSLTAHADAKGVAAGYDLLRRANADGGYLKAKGGKTVGDGSVLTRRQYTNNDGSTTTQLDVVFRAGTVVAEVDLIDYAGETHKVDEVQALAESLATRLAKPPGTPGLGLRTIRLTGNNVTTNYDYYERLNNTEIAYFGETRATARSNDDYYVSQGVTDRYGLRQTVPNTDGKDTDYVDYYLTLYQFGKPAQAAGALKSWKDQTVASPGAGLSAVKEVAGVPKLGDQSAMLSVTYDRGNGVSAPGYLVYVAVGPILAIAVVEAVPGPSQAALTKVAKAVATCLTKGSCSVIAVPAGLGAAA
jgi:hypothetical protein